MKKLIQRNYSTHRIEWIFLIHIFTDDLRRRSWQYKSIYWASIEQQYHPWISKQQSLHKTHIIDCSFARPSLTRFHIQGQCKLPKLFEIPITTIGWTIFLQLEKSADVSFNLAGGEVAWETLHWPTVRSHQELLKVPGNVTPPEHQRIKRRLWPLRIKILLEGAPQD